MRGKKWTEAELEYLQDSWGKTKTEGIALKLGRTYSSIINKARILRLGDPLTHMDGITISRLSKELGIDYHLVANWIEKYNFPAKKKRLAKERRILYVGYADFWEWADKNRQMIDFSRFDKYALGIEPAWANEKRIADFNKKRLVQKTHNTPWTPGDINKLISLAKEPDMTYPKMSKILQRTHGAIKTRMAMEGIKFRPSYLPTHNKYTAREIETLETMMHKGHSFIEIAFILDRSEAGVRGKAERMGYTFKNGVPFKGEKKRGGWMQMIEQLTLLDSCIQVDAEHWEIYEGEKLIGTFESNGSYYHFDSCVGPAVGGTGSIFGNHSIEWFLEGCAEEIRQNYLWHQQKEGISFEANLHGL